MAIIALQYTGNPASSGGNSLADWIVVVFRNPHHLDPDHLRRGTRISQAVSRRGRLASPASAPPIAAERNVLGAFELLLLPSSEPARSPQIQPVLVL